MNNWTHNIISRAAGQVVTLQSVKDNLDITTAEFDTLLQEHIDAAVSWVESHISRFLLPTVVDVFTDTLSLPLRLPFAPIITFTSLTVAGELITPRLVAGSLLLPPSGEGWPYVLKEAGVIEVRYEAGYANAASIPAVVKQAVRLVAGIFYDKPEAKVAEGDWEAVRNLLAPPIRVMSL